MLFSFVLLTDFCFLILAEIEQIFIPITELTVPTGTPTNKANAEIETYTDTRNKSKKMLKVIQSPAHVFMLFTH